MMFLVWADPPLILSPPNTRFGPVVRYIRLQSRGRHGCVPNFRPHPLIFVEFVNVFGKYGVFKIDCLFNARVLYNAHYLALLVYYHPVFIYSILFVIYLIDVYETSFILSRNYTTLWSVELHYTFVRARAVVFEKLCVLDLRAGAGLFVWFPWSSFLNYLTIFGVLYLLIFLSIYNTENTYYLTLYTIFLVFMFAITLVLLDLDIFAGFLLLIESVVILMLFFLIIYISPNISNSKNLQRWRTVSLIVVILGAPSVFSYHTLGNDFFHSFSVSVYFLDEFYEAFSDFTGNDLTGLYTSLYLTNSILLVIIGFLLLIASVICVVLVSFFTGYRNFNMNIFLDLINVAKTCYSFIFLRKQNLSKQGRAAPSTRVVNKKTSNTGAHAEYKVKREVFTKRTQQNK